MFYSLILQEKSSSDSDDSDLEPEDDADDSKDSKAIPRKMKTTEAKSDKKVSLKKGFQTNDYLLFLAYLAAYLWGSSSYLIFRLQASPMKSAKDPNAPKRGMSAFMLWSQHMRPKIKEESPDLKITEIAKVLGEKWKLIGEDSKQEWQEKAEADKARYQEEMKTYVPPKTDSDDDGAKKKKRKAIKDPNAPKKPMSSYFFFMAQVSLT